ncbi:unnamed protein product [Auanema sp. JU1783]|nr:unnamed protein product [Auanema sp. JU1783]
MSKIVYNNDMKNNDIWDDTALIQMYEDSMSDKRRTASSTTNAAHHKWKIGERCMAPFYEDNLWYPAQITSFDEANQKVEVLYDGYDCSDWVLISDLTEEVEAEYFEEDTDSQVESKPNVDVKTRVAAPQPSNEEYPSTSRPLPPFAPPPPPMVLSKLAPPNEVEALSSMLMSWYMSGYHTGYYQCMNDTKRKSNSK